MKRGPVFREADVPVPERWSYFAFEYRIGYDAGQRFKKYFPAPGADTWREKARNAFRAGWKDARKLVAPEGPTTTPQPQNPVNASPRNGV